MKEFKKLVSVILLRWSFSVMPQCKFKIKLSILIQSDLLNGMDEN